MAALTCPAPAAPMRAGTGRLPAAGSPDRDSPAAAARNNVPVRANLPVWIQPRGRAAQPLSGMRCISRQAFDAVQPLARGWGVETAMIVDILRRGYRIDEVPTGFHHRVTGRSFGAQVHRARQFRDVAIALALRYIRGLPRPGNRKPSSLLHRLLRLAGNGEALQLIQVAVDFCECLSVLVDKGERLVGECGVVQHPVQE
jgi:hypothetical protein